jgi:DNA-binding NarL/FixJ family response regulator
MRRAPYRKGAMRQARWGLGLKARGTIMVRILIADGDDASRDRLRRLLDRNVDWRVCGEASTGREAIELALRLAPHVAILDLALPEMNGLEALRRIKRVRPDTEILVLTAHETEDLIRDLLTAGAQACLVKTEAPEHIAAAVAALAEHRPYLTPTVAHAVLDVFLAHGEAGKPSMRPFRVLTAREREILQLLAEGRSNSAISDVLAISVKTVETHRATIMRKLGVSSLAELVRYAIRNRVIDET